ncbi:MAG TPA: hypothetical protein VFP36_10050 [Usitatibacter sp.]|nr:hypothetical protein [Usitatibacter sp.]
MVEIRIPFANRSRADFPAPSAAAAIGAGLIAGTVAFALMQSFAVLVYDESPWKLARMMAAIVRGPQALAPQDEFDAAIVALGLGTHYTLSLLYALALAGVLRELPRDMGPLIGLAFGVTLYLANLHGFTRLFPWFAELRTIDTLVAHAVFGLIAAGAYCGLAWCEEPSGE